MNSKSALLIAVVFAAALPILRADDTLTSKRKFHASTMSIKRASTIKDYDWSLEGGSGILLGDVRTDLKGYTMVPAQLAGSLKIDDVSLDDFAGGIFRGYTEFVFRAYGMAVLHGYESRFVGMQYGPRYNFVQPGWKFVPFIDGRVGFGFNDSQGITEGTKQVGQGQDFSFNFGIAAGTRYDINDSWFLRLAATYEHFSNAGLSEPARKNRAIDVAGPELTIGYRF